MSEKTIIFHVTITGVDNKTDKQVTWDGAVATVSENGNNLTLHMMYPTKTGD